MVSWINHKRDRLAQRASGTGWRSGINHKRDRLAQRDREQRDRLAQRDLRDRHSAEEGQPSAGPAGTLPRRRLLTLTSNVRSV